MTIKGIKFSEEHKRKISLANSGKKRTEEAKKKMSLAHIGKKFSEEHKLKLKGRIAWNKGKKCSFPSRRGIKLSEEHRAKLSAAKVGKPPQPHKAGCKCFRCSKIPHNKGKPWNKGHKFTRQEVFGENNFNWKGGVSKIFPSERDKLKIELRKWSKDVLVRDGFSCCLCHKVGGHLHAHHIKSFAEYPELRLDMDNGITLCVECHKYIHSKDGKIDNVFL